MSPEYNYKPLPDFLTIKKSKIHGKGLFMRKGCTAPLFEELGITHHIVNDGVIRTPLGGWLNDGGVNANCTLMPADDKGKRVPFGSQTCYVLIVNKYKVGGDELTLNYSNWEWILDGSLYPSRRHDTDINNNHSAYDAKSAVDMFYSPYRASAELPKVDVTNINMSQTDVFSTKLVGTKGNSNTNIVEEYVGAPGGIEKVNLNDDIQNGKYSASDIVYLLTK